MKKPKETDKCKICGINSIPSKGFGNAYSEPDAVGKRTIYEGRGALIDCRKCPNCGRSWTVGKSKEISDYKKERTEYEVKVNKVNKNIKNRLNGKR